MALEDLGFSIADSDHCSYEAEVNRSILASYASYSQQSYRMASNLPQIQYSVAVIPSHWLRELCLNNLLKGYWIYQLTDDPRWGAERVYQRDPSSGISRYLLLYSDRIISFHASWNLSDEQIAVVARQLAG